MIYGTLFVTLNIWQALKVVVLSSKTTVSRFAFAQLNICLVEPIFLGYSEVCVRFDTQHSGSFHENIRHRLRSASNFVRHFCQILMIINKEWFVCFNENLTDKISCPSLHNQYSHCIIPWQFLSYPFTVDTA